MEDFVEVLLDTSSPKDYLTFLRVKVLPRVRLYSNPDEVVFDPFMGIGSTGYVATCHGRRAYGCELRTDWHGRALAEIARGERECKEAQRTLFDLAAD